MIIPTPDFDPLFAEDGTPFRARMVDYIEREFADVLGPNAGLLHSEKGLEILSHLYLPRSIQITDRRDAA